MSTRVLADVTEPAGKDTTTGEQLYRRYWAYGYIHAGIEAAPISEDRVLILIDETQTGPLEKHMGTLRADLESEGWTVEIQSVPRTEDFDGAAVENIRSVIKAAASADGPTLTTVMLVGRIAVPYSGRMAPDGHTPDHVGAWPADAIYGDLDGTYTDNVINSPNTQRPKNNNVPGDGKYDQSLIASDLELAIGRIDMYDMPQFEASETELLQAYFTKNHAFRSGQFEMITGGIIDDNFGAYGGVVCVVTLAHVSAVWL